MTIDGCTPVPRELHNKKGNKRILPLDTHRVVGRECHAPNLSQRTNTNELRDRLGKQRGRPGSRPRIRVACWLKNGARIRHLSPRVMICPPTHTSLRGEASDGSSRSIYMLNSLRFVDRAAWPGRLRERFRLAVHPGRDAQEGLRTTRCESSGTT